MGNESTRRQIKDLQASAVAKLRLASVYFLNVAIICIIFIVSFFVSCLYAQVYLDSQTAKKVISELVELDGLKKTYSLLDQRFEVLETEHNKLRKDYTELFAKNQQDLANFEAYKAKRKKRGKSGKFIVAGFGAVLTAIAIDNLEGLRFNDGIGSALLVGAGIYFSIPIVL